MSANDDQVGKSFELLKAGLVPFLERELDRFNAETAGTDTYMKDPRRKTAIRPLAEWDAGGLLRLTWEGWACYSFRRSLSLEDKNVARELWATRMCFHDNQAFSNDQARRTLQDAAQLLTAVTAPEAAE